MKFWADRIEEQERSRKGINQNNEKGTISFSNQLLGKLYILVSESFHSCLPARLPACLILLLVCQSYWLPGCLNVCLPNNLSTCLLAWLHACLFCQPACRPSSILFCLPSFSSWHLAFSASVFLPACLPACPYAMIVCSLHCLLTCLFVCLFVCLFQFINSLRFTPNT